MLFKVLSGFKYRALCDIEFEKKLKEEWGKRNHLQKEWCQGSKVWSSLERGQVIRKRWQVPTNSADPIGQ